VKIPNTDESGVGGATLVTRQQYQDQHHGKNTIDEAERYGLSPRVSRI
jgi:hypothetical protein